MTSIRKAPTHTLRGILRYLKDHCPSSNVSATADFQDTVSEQSAPAFPPSRRFVLDRYRSSVSLSPSSSEAARLRSLAADYLALVSDVSERKTLHDLDAGVERKLSPREMSRRSAARAGLLLPEVDPP